MGSRSKQGRNRFLKGRPGPTVISSPLYMGGDLVEGFSLDAEPSAIDLLGDLAVSEEERKLRIQRREPVRFDLHTFDIVADPPDPNCRMLSTTTSTVVPDPQLGPPQP